MAGPPKDIEPSALWTKLASRERPTKLVDFPWYDDKGDAIGQVRIQILTQNEKMASTMAAEEAARKYIKEGKRGDLGYERLFSDAYIVETLYRACRSAENSKYPAFRSTDDMRAKMTTEECGALFDHYLTVQLELGPMATSMSQAEMEAWIDRLVEGGSANPSNLLSLEQSQLLLLYTAFQYRNSQKDSSSAGEQPEESISESSEPTTSEPLPQEPEPS